MFKEHTHHIALQRRSATHIHPYLSTIHHNHYKPFANPREKMAYADGATLLVEPHTAGPKRIPSPLTASDATFLRAILPDQITNDVNFEIFIVVMGDQWGHCAT
jgi:hypothetical protein